MTDKLCSACHESKPIDQFHKNQHRCKKCQSKYHADWREKNKEKRAEYQRDWYKDNREAVQKQHQEYYQNNKDAFRKNERKRRYGLTDEQYQEMYAKQEGKCAICRCEDMGGKNGLHVDHDHEAGKVRALLCAQCNQGLGKFRDSVPTLQRAIAYLQEHEG